MREERKTCSHYWVSCTPGGEASFLWRESTEHQQGAGREAQRPVRGEVSGRAQDKGTPQKQNRGDKAKSLERGEREAEKREQETRFSVGFLPTNSIRSGTLIRTRV